MRSASLRSTPLALRAVDEDALLLRHLLGLLLAHRAAEQVGAAERVARELLGDLHHLLLVDDDAVGGREQLVDRAGAADAIGCAAVLAVDEVLDHPGAERARAVERDGGDDVLEAVGACRSLKSCCIPLDSSWKTPLVSPDAEELVRRAVVERDASLEMSRALRLRRRSDRGRALMRRTAMSRTVSVFRPRKSNLTSPACSTSSL